MQGALLLGQTPPHINSDGYTSAGLVPSPRDRPQLHSLLAAVMPASASSVFAFEWCSCVYESGFSIISLHATKQGALRAMVREANLRWQAGRDNDLRFGRLSSRMDPLCHEAWRVREIPVLPATDGRRQPKPRLKRLSKTAALLQRPWPRKTIRKSLARANVRPAD